MGRRRRRQIPEYVDNHERWLVSYADFITLLFAFFVVLYSTSRVSAGSFRVMSDSILDAFEVPHQGVNDGASGAAARSDLEDQERAGQEGVNPLVAPLRKAASGDDAGDVGAAVVESGREGPASNSPYGDDAFAVKEVNAVATALEDALGELVAPDVMGIRRNPTWVQLKIPASLLFPSGSRVLLSSASSLLERVADTLRDLPNAIEVQGHTDNRPLRNGLFDSNWELSAARSVVVARALADLGVDPARLSATGFAGYHPIEDNATAEGRAANQRLVLNISTTGLGDTDIQALQRQVDDG